MASIVISFASATGRRDLYGASVASILEGELARDLTLAVTDRHFWPCAHPRKVAISTSFNPTWLASPPAELHLAPREQGKAEALLDNDNPARDTDGRELPGYRQSLAMFMSDYATPNARVDTRDLAFTAMAYLAARLSDRAGLKGIEAVRAPANALIALASASDDALELDDPMPLGYLDPLLAAGLIGIAGVVDGNSRWIDGPAVARIPEQQVQDLISAFDDGFIARCGAIDPRILRPTEKDTLSAHDTIAAEAFFSDAVIPLQSDFVSRLKDLGHSLLMLSTSVKDSR